MSKKSIEDRIHDATSAIISGWADLLDMPSGSAIGRTAPKALTQAEDHDDTDADMDTLTRRISLRRFAMDVLGATSRMVMEERPITSPKALPLGDDVPGMCEFLDRHAEWIAEEWIDPDGIADELESLAGHIEVITAPKRKEWIYLGTCPFVTFDDDGVGRICRGRVRSAIGSDGDEAACSVHGDLAPIEWWENVLGTSLLGRIVGTSELVAALSTRLHVTVKEWTIRKWARDGLITAHVPFGPVENPRRPRRAWWFDLGVVIEEVAMMHRACAMCERPLVGRGSVCLACLSVMHNGPIFQAEKPAYAFGSVAPAPPPPLPQCSLDERARCDLTDMPIRWCGCVAHRGS